MTAAEFNAALAELRLRHGARLTGRLLGIGWRQVTRYATGRAPVAPAVTVLVRLLVIMHRAGISPVEADRLLAKKLPWQKFSNGDQNQLPPGD